MKRKSQKLSLDDSNENVLFEILVRILRGIFQREKTKSKEPQMKVDSEKSIMFKCFSLKPKKTSKPTPSPKPISKVGSQWVRLPYPPPQEQVRKSMILKVVLR